MRTPSFEKLLSLLVSCLLTRKQDNTNKPFPLHLPNLMTMSIIDAAIWSAIAALFAALSSFFTMLIHRRNLLELVRPELVLDGWNRKTMAWEDTIAFSTIKNVGRGTAYKIFMSDSKTVDNHLIYLLSTTRFPILAPNETKDIDSTLKIFWDHVNVDNTGHKHLTITISISSFDSRNTHYKTLYNLFISRQLQNSLMLDTIVEGVFLNSRKVTTEPAWRHKLSKMIVRIPILMRLYRKAD